MNLKSYFFLIVLTGMVQTGLAQDQATLGGYGELHYNDVVSTPEGENPPGTLDFHRFILFAGYDFNDWISFRSELELEHTLIEAEDSGEAEGGEVALEQAYIDLRYRPSLGVRTGLILVPVGIINPVHEPPTFNGVERPNVDKYVIPTTWREPGIGLYGRLANRLSYQAYLMAGLDASGISGEEGIRGARQNGFEASTDNLAFTARVDYQATLNLSLGTSVYRSGLATDAVLGDALNGVSFSLIEVHALYQRNGWAARGLLVYSAITNVEKLYVTFGNAAGASQIGGYVELAYDVLGLVEPQSEQEVSVFVRYEPYNTHLTTGTGVTANPAFNRRETTFGVTYRPTAQVALKADYQLLYSEGASDVRQFNLGVGYNF